MEDVTTTTGILSLTIFKVFGDHYFQSKEIKLLQGLN